MIGLSLLFSFSVGLLLMMSTCKVKSAPPPSPPPTTTTAQAPQIPVLKCDGKCKGCLDLLGMCSFPGRGNCPKNTVDCYSKKSPTDRSNFY